MQTATPRKCHFCHERIADAARVCPHCGADLIHVPPLHPPPQAVDAVADGGTFAAFIRARFTTRTVLQSAGLFVVLVVIYAIYLRGIVEGIVSGPREIALSDLIWPLAKYCVISGAPFAALAAADREWQSESAARVAMTAWAAVFSFVSRRYGSDGCPVSFALFFIPLVFSAAAAHTIGRASSVGRTGRALVNRN